MDDNEEINKFYKRYKKNDDIIKEILEMYKK